MNAFIIRIVVVAAGAATLMAAPARADCINSPTDISCGPANVNPANPLSPNNPLNSDDDYGYGNGYGYGANGLGVLGLLSSVLGDDQPAPTAYPGDGYAPVQAPVVHHRHHHRRHKPAP